MKQSVYNFGKVGRRIVVYLVLFYLAVSVIPPTYTVGIPALCAKYGWDYGQIMAINTVGGWASIPITLIFARIVDKKGNRWPSLIIMILCAAAVFGMAAPTLPVFMAALFLENAFNNAPVMVTPNAMVAEWFPRKKGIVLGITSTGLLLGGVVVLPVFSAVTSAVSVNAAYIVLAVYTLVVGLGIIFIKDKPEEMGCFPDNDPDYVRPAKPEQTTHYKLSSYLKQGKFWLMVLSYGLSFFAMMILISTGTLILEEAGASGGMSIGIIVIGSICGIVGSIALGYMDQVKGPKPASVLTAILMLAGALMIGLFFHSGLIIVIAIGICIFYFAMGAVANLSFSMAITVYGPEEFNSMNTLYAPLLVAIRTTSYMVVGIAFNASGSYLSSCWIMAAAIVVALVILFAVPRGSAPVKEEKV